MATMTDLLLTPATSPPIGGRFGIWWRGGGGRFQKKSRIKDETRRAAGGTKWEKVARVTAEADKLNLDLLRRKDAGEFTRFVRCHERFVMGICQTLGLSAADRDDAAAETFAAAYAALERFRGEAELTTWLYRIAYRSAMKVRRRYPVTAALGQDGPEPADPAEKTADVAVQEREDFAAVWQAVSRLDPEQAVAVELFYRREMSVEEVGAVMEKPAGTIKTLLYRARERLRFLLRELEKSP